MKHLVRAALCAASLAAISAPAQATQVIVTYAGTVHSGVDIDGLFGTAGADLKRQGFTLSFTVDTSNFQTIAGAPSSGIAYMGSVLATMTIGGRSYTINGAFPDSSVAQWAPPAPDGDYDYQINGDVAAANGDWANANVASFYDYFGAMGLTTPLFHTVSRNDDAADANFSGGNTLLNDNRVSSISVEVLASPTSAPEPASWAMMIGGFGAIGAVMRRNRRTTVRFA
jgi:hypothetical protein